MNNSELLSLSTLVKTSAKKLALVSDSAILDARILLAFVIKKPISYLLTWPEKTLTSSQYLKFISLLEQRILGHPIAYLVGYKEFWSLKLHVSPATLIPRPDTEILVETVLNNHQVNSLNCLDLGTGTGAIALALASEQPNWHIEAVDYQLEAVQLATLNANSLQLNQVKVYQSDWFSNVKVSAGFDIIVSNPPYIDEQDQHLVEGDVVFEPRSALVARQNGFADIAQIIKNAKRFLSNNGWLYFEHGFEQALAVRHLFAQSGYINIKTIKDYNNNDRVTFACYSQEY